MGASYLFDEITADFSGMNSIIKLYISKILHKCFLEVNEDGTEAVAVTSVIFNMGNTSSPPQPVYAEFKCNRPFLFFIHDNQYKTILFMGKCSEPNPYAEKMEVKNVSCRHYKYIDTKKSPTQLRKHKKKTDKKEKKK